MTLIPGDGIGLNISESARKIIGATRSRMKAQKW